MNRLLFIVFILSVLYSGCGEDPVEVILKKVADDGIINDTHILAALITYQFLDK